MDVENIITADAINSITLPTDSGLKRDARRAAKHIGPAFHAYFDAHTLFYDIYFAPQSGKIELLGPPLFNLASLVENIELNGQIVSVKRSRTKRQSIWTIKINSLPDNNNEVRLNLSFQDQSLSFKIAPADTRFTDKRVLLSMFRYEPITWVKDWIEYHVKVHGFDAALLYCNNLANYSTTELYHALQDIDGLDSLLLVEWNFPYGPANHDCGREPWMSAFCKPAMFEHARKRYLYAANIVLNLDIDELLVTSDGQGFAHQSHHNDDTKGFLLPETIISGPKHTLDIPLHNRRHHTYHEYIASNEPQFKDTSKWVIFPKNSSTDTRWFTHSVNGTVLEKAADQFWFAHFMALNTGWKNEAKQSMVSTHGPSAPLMAHFKHLGWL